MFSANSAWPLRRTKSRIWAQIEVKSKIWCGSRNQGSKIPPFWYFVWYVSIRYQSSGHNPTTLIRGGGDFSRHTIPDLMKQRTSSLAHWPDTLFRRYSNLNQDKTHRTHYSYIKIFLTRWRFIVVYDSPQPQTRHFNAILTQSRLPDIKNLSNHILFIRSKNDSLWLIETSWRLILVLTHWNSFSLTKAALNFI